MPHRNIRVSNLTPGSVLAEPVCDGTTRKLLGSGYTMNEHLIKRLAEFGIASVAVEDETTNSTRRVRTSVSANFNTVQQRSTNGPLTAARDCVCGKSIAIKPPVSDQPVVALACDTCGLIYFGYGEAGESLKYLGVKPVCDGVINEVEVDENESESEKPADDQQAGSEPGAADNPRRDKRHAIALPVVVIPLSREFRVAGAAVPMKVRNISQVGCALASTRFSDFPNYALDFTLAGIELLQVALRVLGVGHNGPSYEIAGKFTRRLNQTGSPRI